MARPTVPRCKECSYLRNYCSPGAKYGRWFCRFPNLPGRHRITSQEVRTCPDWCPLRLAGYRKAYK